MIFFDYSNIKGRSGRMMEHYVGKIYNFCKPPDKEQIIIDIPFYEQNPDILSDEILINIPADDLKQSLVERYNTLYEIPNALLDIIKKNGVSINGQLSVYYTLEKYVNTHLYKKFAWTQTPNYEQLVFVLNIAHDNLFDFNNSNTVRSVEQLVVYINKYRASKNLISIVEDMYQYKAKKVKNLTKERQIKYYDESIEKAFHLYRHWFQYTVPKVLRVVDSIQRYVSQKYNKESGSYSYFVQQLENDFIRENLSILSEYGVPVSTIKILERIVPSKMHEDDVIEFIRNEYKKVEKYLMIYEIEKLKRIL